jgi:DNA-binding MarR family transcriptional regulator
MRNPRKAKPLQEKTVPHAQPYPAGLDRQPANAISFRIQHVASLLLKESDQVLQEQLGIGMSQLRIMRILQRNPHMLQRQIAKMLNQTEASISRQVKLLYSKQLLTTHLNPKDRREHMTILTSKGLRIIEAALEVLELFQAPLVSDFSEKQQVEFLNILGKIEERSARGGQ